MGVKNSPVYFLREILGSHSYDVQERIIEAIATEPRVSIAGCNGSGKDWILARAILWWLSSRYPAKVVVTGPTSRQVEDVVWNELRFAHRNARMALGGRLLPSTARWQIDEQHFAIGFSTDNPYNLQGYHSPNLLAVITEAHAIKQADVDALRRLNPRCFVMSGNPFATTGEFFDSHHTRRHLYKTIPISAFDTPNLQEGAPGRGWPEYAGMVTKEDVANRAEEYGEGNPLYIAGVLGEFPDNLDDNIVSLTMATAAAAREIKAGDDAVVLSCDVARFGRDKTVVVRRQGKVARIVWRVQGRDLMKIAGWLGNHLQENPDVERIVIDDTGVGGGVTDRLREMGTGNARLVAFNGGASASKRRTGGKPHAEMYVNAISEAWMLMRKWFIEEEPDIDDDSALIGQLSGRQYYYESDKRVKIEGKRAMAKEGKKSPDEADALAMTFAADGGRPGVWFL